MMLSTTVQVKKLAICLVFVSMLSACITRKGKRSPLSFSSNESFEFNKKNDQPSLEPLTLSLQEVRQLEAKHADLPIPMNAVPVPGLCVSDRERNEQLKLAYCCSSPAETIALFYDQRMEGWQEVGRFECGEFLIHYQRPGRWCSICISTAHSKHEPNLFIYMASSKQTA